jgi:hypothetical protein
MAGFYSAALSKMPALQWPGLSPPCTPAGSFARTSVTDLDSMVLLRVGYEPAWVQCPDRRAAALKLVWRKGASEDADSHANCVTANQHDERLEW